CTIGAPSFGAPSSPTAHRLTHLRRGSDQSIGAVQKTGHEEMINNPKSHLRAQSAPPHDQQSKPSTIFLAKHHLVTIAHGQQISLARLGSRPLCKSVVHHNDGSQNSQQATHLQTQQQHFFPKSRAPCSNRTMQQASAQEPASTQRPAGPSIRSQQPICTVHSMVTRAPSHGTHPSALHQPDPGPSTPLAGKLHRIITKI
ncbi:hypothetical protein ACLOJK_006851, partial [Asimina triloba]